MAEIKDKSYKKMAVMPFTGPGMLGTVGRLGSMIGSKLPVAGKITAGYAGFEVAHQAGLFKPIEKGAESIGQLQTYGEKKGLENRGKFFRRKWAKKYGLGEAAYLLPNPEEFPEEYASPGELKEGWQERFYLNEEPAVYTESEVREIVQAHKKKDNILEHFGESERASTRRGRKAIEMTEY